MNEYFCHKDGWGQGITESDRLVAKQPLDRLVWQRLGQRLRAEFADTAAAPRPEGFDALIAMIGQQIDGGKDD